MAIAAQTQTIYYFSATHWDREWYQSFQGFRYRLVNMINEAIDVLEKDPAFRVFHMDGQTVILEDYLKIEPDKRTRLEKLIKDRRLLIGPWYVMPDEFLVSGESHSAICRWGSRFAAAGRLNHGDMATSVISSDILPRCRRFSTAFKFIMLSWAAVRMSTTHLHISAGKVLTAVNA